MADLIERDGVLIAPLDLDLKLVAESKAALFRIFYPDGRVELRGKLAAKSEWREEDHPRQPAGTSEGGEFAQAALDVTDIHEDLGNPRWLSWEQKLAEDNGPYPSGADTGDVRISNFPLAELVKLPGRENEHRLANFETDDKTLDLLASFKAGEPIKSPVFVTVNYKGQAWISEGNHRVHVGHKFGLKTTPVLIRYFAGGQNAPGQFNIERFRTLKKSWLSAVLKYSPDQPRGKSTPESNAGSFISAEGWADVPSALADVENAGSFEHEAGLSSLKKELAYVGLSAEEEQEIHENVYLTEGMVVEPGQPMNLLGYCMDTAGSETFQTRRFIVAFNDRVLNDKRVLGALPGIREFVLTHEIGHALLMLHNIPEKNAGNLPVGIGEINDAMRKLASEARSLAEKGVPPEQNQANKARDVLEYLKLIYHRDGGVHEYFADSYAYLRGAQTIRGVPRKAYEQVFPTTIRVMTKIWKETYPDFVPAVRLKSLTDRYADDIGVPHSDVTKADDLLSAIPGWWVGYIMDHRDCLVPLPVVGRG